MEPEDKIPIPTRRKELRHINVSQENFKVAYDFAGEIYKKFGPLALSVIMFGSAAKDTAKKDSDIDIMIVVDNTSQVWDEEVISYYREELFKITKKNAHRDKLHINTITLSTFWDNVKVGDPAAINVLRYGVALLDLGFFEPLKYLLLQGRIRPSAEAIYTVLNRTPWHFIRAKVKILSAVEDYYWAMVNSAHAALMTFGHTPPSPEFVPRLLHETFGKQNKMPRKYIDWYNELYELWHNIKANKVESIPGEDIDLWAKRAQEFARFMEKLTKEGEKKYFEKFA